MKQYLKHDEWKIIEEGFHKKHNRITESVFSIGNGRMGQRANFEEQYSGDSLQGNYIAGVYYPDKTRVGWWKNGYPEYFAKVLNAVNWIGIDIKINNDELDLHQCKISDFRRVLDMKKGILSRSFTAKLKNGIKVKVKTVRFCSIVDDETAAIRYSITLLNKKAKLEIKPYLDFDVINEDANYDEKFWEEVNRMTGKRSGYVTAKTKKLNFHVCSGMQIRIDHNGKTSKNPFSSTEKNKYVAQTAKLKAKKRDEITIFKYVANLSSENHPKTAMLKICKKVLKQATQKGFDQLLDEQKIAWGAKWKESDITIEGDVAAQQGIRFNIFQLNQTYTGEDERLNIGPKGFTGEKYGGSTYWDTEAYCFPFYLSSAEPRVARNLLIYRYKHLPKAIENANKLGFNSGAALYPMVTMNGEECHNEWEITFEEIHRNGAIAFAIYDYIRYTGDKDYLSQYGLPVLIAIARFWAQRVNFSNEKNKFVLLGVTGPNEYENNVNNNWYTLYIAKWCLEYARDAVHYVRKTAPERYAAISAKYHFNDRAEIRRWNKVSRNLYFPENKDLGIFLQQDGFLDKEQKLAKDIPEEQTPIWQNWSWDRILRSVYIKQADVLQGLYLFEDHFDEVTVKRNFDYYEPRTVHESSLSPCVHVIHAARLGYEKKAYELYLRTSRLDLDDYNNDTEDGCHITSMGGTWMSVIKGFGGMRVRRDHLYFSPLLPRQWKSLTFKIRFRENLLSVRIGPTEAEIFNHSKGDIKIYVHNKPRIIQGKQSQTVSYKPKRQPIAT
ncbi:MAG: glycoside hydrolase family 65 protein [Bacteroidota bacterium]